jgi:hypothetical protein
MARKSTTGSPAAKSQTAKSLTKTRLTDIALATKPETCRRNVPWHERISAEDREQLEDLKKAYKSGKLDPNWSARALFVEIVQPSGMQLPVSAETFRRWIAE